MNLNKIKQTIDLSFDKLDKNSGFIENMVKEIEKCCNGNNNDEKKRVRVRG